VYATHVLVATRDHDLRHVNMYFFNANNVPDRLIYKGVQDQLLHPFGVIVFPIRPFKM
jgi:hypothetical protein